MASERELDTVIEVLEAEVKMRDAREGAWESDGQRAWFVSAAAHLGEYQAKLAADAAAGTLTDKGLAARAASHRDPVVQLSERFDATARERRAAVAASEAQAWKDELARPPGVSEVAHLLQLTDLRQQLAALPDHEQHTLLLEDSPRGQLCRRTAYAWPSLRPFGLPQTAADVRSTVLARRGPQGSANAEARDLAMLATVLRRAVGLGREREPVLQSRRGDGAAP